MKRFPMFKCLCGWMTAAIVILTVVSAQAQDPPPGRWWRSPQIVKELQLTGSEVQQLDNAFEASRVNMIKLKSRVEAEQFKLESMVNQRGAKDSEIKSQYRNLEKARSDLADERFAFFVKARNIIGYERFQKLLDMAPGGKGRKR